METPGGSGFKSSGGQIHVDQSLSQTARRRQRIRTGVDNGVANNDSSIQESTRCQNHNRCLINAAGRRHDATNLRQLRVAFVCEEHIHDFMLHQQEVFLLLQYTFHISLIVNAVHLSARRNNRRPLGRIQHPKLDHIAIRNLAHLPAECINFSHQLSLGSTANIRITR